MANELFEISFIFFILLLHKKEIIMYNKQVRKYFICISIFSEIHHPVTYRSGHNELDSKSSCRATGTWVRIPPSPFLKYGSTLIFYLAASCNLAAFLLCESPAKRPKDKRTDTPLLCCFISANSRAFIIVKTSSCLLGEASSQRASISLIVVISFSVSSSCRR